MTATRDPVCGMTIDERSAAETSQHDGRTFYFCSRSCKEEFDRHPASYRDVD